MNPDPLPVVLRFIADDAGRVREVAHELRGETRATEAALDDLEARAAAITARLLGAELKRPPTPPRLRPVTDRAPADWDRLLVRAAAVAETEGPSDDMWRIDDLLADGIAERIERLHGTLELRTTLDHGDIAAVVVAGVAGLEGRSHRRRPIDRRPAKTCRPRRQLVCPPRIRAVRSGRRR